MTKCVITEAIEVIAKVMAKKENMKICFTVLGEPIAKGRPKFFRRGEFMGTYTPNKTKTAENDFLKQALLSSPDKPIGGAISLDLKIYRSIPKSFSNKKKRLVDHGILLPTTKPDIDNYAKLVLDAMNSIFWNDDKQVVRLSAVKQYSSNPRIEVELIEL